ncbi:NAD(P)-dependent dehydrogenase (short-subunit alcohol dehydrogenase family) [Nocardia sp. GAS34]
MKKVLITGAGSGLGKGTAIGLARAGHAVIATTQIWPQVSELRAPGHLGVTRTDRLPRAATHVIAFPGGWLAESR